MIYISDYFNWKKTQEKRFKMSVPLIDNKALQELLPHRYPFLLVDRVLEIELNVSIKALKNVTCNEPHFTGHFPGHPIMPGVLIIEALAQTAGVLMLKSNEAYADGKTIFYLAGIDNARFKRTVLPGDQLELYVEVMRKRLDLWKFRCTASVNGEIACVAEIMNVKG